MTVATAALLGAELTHKTLWNPTILGVLVFISAVMLFCGSVYLLLGTNLGARLGFLVAAALQRLGRRRHAGDGGARRRPERLDFADRAAELVGIRGGFAFGARRRDALHFALFGIGFQRAFQRR